MLSLILHLAGYRANIEWTCSDCIQGVLVLVPNRIYASNEIGVFHAVCGLR